MARWVAHELCNKKNLKYIEFFWKEVRSLPEDIDTVIKDEILRIDPGFYKYFVIQEGELISQKKLNENLLIREYWNGSFDLYDIEVQKIIKESQDSDRIVQLNSRIVEIRHIDRPDHNIVEFYDIRTKKVIGKFQRVHKILPLNDCIVAIQHARTFDRNICTHYCYRVNFYDTTEQEIIEEFHNVIEVLPLNDYTVAMRHFDYTLKFYDIRTKEEIKEFHNVKKIVKLNSHTVAIHHSDNTLTLYDIEVKEVIEELQEVYSIFPLNDHIVSIQHARTFDRNICTHYCYHVNFYDTTEQEIIEEFHNVIDVLPLNDHIVSIQFAPRGKDYSAKLYDLRNSEVIQEWSLLELYLSDGISRLNDHIMTIKYIDKTLKLYDIKTKKVIEKFQRVHKILPLNDYLIAIQYYGNILECYDFETKKTVWKKKGSIKQIELLGDQSVAIIYDRSVEIFNFRRNSDTLDIFDEGGNKIIKSIKFELKGPFRKSDIKVRGNNIWIKVNHKLARLGPALILEKLNTSQQLLLFMLVKRSEKHPKEINSVMWESIDSALQKELLEELNERKFIDLAKFSLILTDRGYLRRLADYFS